MKYFCYNLRNFKEIEFFARNKNYFEIIETLGSVLPFKTNNYVVNELIDWQNWEKDPIFILNFPQKEMISNQDFEKVNFALKNNFSNENLQTIISEIRKNLNPHPGKQIENNIPTLNGEKLHGIQHKYQETILCFPAPGQTCHAFCSFCFRWPQFVGMDELKFSLKQPSKMIEYLKIHPEITDILFTGGDPMTMNANNLSKFILPLLDLSTVNAIRIGTKVLSFFPYRFLTEPDSDEVLKLFEKVKKSGKHLTLMAHISHPNELKTEALRKAVERIRNAGVEIRTQSPILRNINDSAEIWKKLWEKQIQLGMIPYYTFIARNTGGHRYFALPLVKTYEIFRDAYSSVSGICKTVRGPIMSSNPGKVQVIGITEIAKEKLLMLNFVQARNPAWVQKPFFAQYDEKAAWLNELKPAFGEKEFFFEPEFSE